MSHKIYCMLRVIIMPTFSSLGALQVVILTTCSAATDDKVGILKTQFLDAVCPIRSSENWELSWCQLCHHRWHCRLSFVIMTTCSAANNDKVGIIKTPFLDAVYSLRYAHGFVVLCFVVVIILWVINRSMWFIYPYSSGLLHWHWRIIRLSWCLWSNPEWYV